MSRELIRVVTFPKRSRTAHFMGDDWGPICGAVAGKDTASWIVEAWEERHLPICKRCRARASQLSESWLALLAESEANPS